MNPSGGRHPIPAKTVDETRALLAAGEPDGDVSLIDVREPEEYEARHIPGARLIPTGEIMSRLVEIEKGKTIVVYCRSGHRSGAVTALMAGAGFPRVYNMEGGMLAWEGMTATGAPQAGMFLFDQNAGLEALMAEAWKLEEGMRRFYASVAGGAEDREARNLFEKLTEAEQRHKSFLADMHARIAGGEGPGLDAGGAGDEYLESGIKAGEAIEWSATAPLADILDFSMSAEINSYDLYLKLARRADDPDTAGFFRTMAAEERRHLKKMGALLGRQV